MKTEGAWEERSAENEGGGEESLSYEECLRLLQKIPQLGVDAQLEAFEKVLRFPDEDVRRRILGLGASLLSDDRLVEFLRDDADDVRRNAGIEMLKLRRRRAFQLAEMLVDDDDYDVALQAVVVLGHLSDRRAIEPLRRLLQHEDVNIVQEAIIALGRLGDVRAQNDLLPFLKQSPWVQTAAIEALGKMGAVEAIPQLVALLEDPVASSFVVDALARIGGAQAIQALAQHWLRHEEDTEPLLQRLAYMLENLTGPVPRALGFERALKDCTLSSDKNTRLAAVRCLVVIRGRNRPLVSF